jgi:hypothetical protein
MDLFSPHTLQIMSVFFSQLDVYALFSHVIHLLLPGLKSFMGKSMLQVLQVLVVVIKMRGLMSPPHYNRYSVESQPIVGAVRATGVNPVVARSNGKLCAFLSCITSKPRLARFSTSAQVGITLP